MTVQTLHIRRDDDGQFDLFWKKLKMLSLSLDVEEPRKCKVPQRYEGPAEPKSPDDFKQYFRIIYIEAVDLIISSISEKFDKLGYTTYKNLKDLLLKAIRKE